MLLHIDKINTFYGKLHALWNVSIDVDTKEIVALLGSNGAGKTTLLKSIVGFTPPKSGNIVFNDKDIHGIKPHQLVKQGITLAPEGRQIFPRMTVLENLHMGAYTRKTGEFATSVERTYELFPILFERKEQAAGTLSGGEQQMLAIGRALMSNPKLLLLDEPSLGLSPLLTEKIFELILQIRNQGVTILLVEQNAAAALAIADRAYVLETGNVSLTGTGISLLSSDEIIMSYLGGKTQ